MAWYQAVLEYGTCSACGIFYVLSAVQWAMFFVLFMVTQHLQQSLNVLLVLAEVMLFVLYLASSISHHMPSLTHAHSLTHAYTLSLSNTPSL